MNDNPTTSPIQPKLGNPEVISVLESALARAKAGQVHGVAVIMVMGPDVPSMASAGAFPSTIIAGCQQLTRLLLDGMFNQKRSPILMPRRQ